MFFFPNGFLNCFRNTLVGRFDKELLKVHQSKIYSQFTGEKVARKNIKSPKLFLFSGFVAIRLVLKYIIVCVIVLVDAARR